jgi:hypothetical protein
MATLVRTWLGLAALGAGCVHLAVAAGSPLAALAGFSLLGAAELAWGVGALAREAVPLPRLALAGAAVAVAVELLVLLGPVAASAHEGMRAMTGQGLPALPLLGAAVLDLVAAAGLALVVRRGRRPEGPFPPVWGYLAGVVSGAALVGALTSASLGATPVGALAMHGMAMGH